MIFHRLLNAIDVTANEIGLDKNQTLDKLVPKIVPFLIELGGALAVIFIIIGGLLITQSRGDAAQYKRGRDTITYAVVGLVVAMVAYAIVTFVTKSVTSGQ